MDSGAESIDWDMKYLMPDLNDDELERAGAKWRADYGSRSPMDADGATIARFMRQFGRGDAGSFAQL